jgi:hypothetical protein
LTTLITLFSAPKPFTEPHIATIQRNAIKSWGLLPEVEVILLGQEFGLAEAAHDLGAKHLPDVRRNDKGTPLISSMFQLAQESGRGELLCIINADILLLPDFVECAQICRSLGSRSRFKRDLRDFVLLSQRWDLDVTAPLEFARGWQERLRERVEREGELHRPAGSDFFLFPRSCYRDVPDFVIGRAGWDNWMIYKARQEKWPVIDGTPSVTIVHQNHDYGHLPGGQSHYSLPESDENIRLAGGAAAVRYTILDSTHRLVGGELMRPRPSYLRFMRGLELFLRRIFSFLPESLRENVVRPKRWRKRFQKLLGRAKKEPVK